MGKRERSGKRHPGQARGKGGRRLNWLYFSIALAVVVALGLGVGLALGGGSSAPEDQAAQQGNTREPSWLKAAPASYREAYAYAVASPETLSYIPCYCGCGAHSGHKSIHDCFVAGRNPDGTVVYDTHGVSCDMCVDSALLTKRMVKDGKSVMEARQAVVSKYSSLGPSTDTPLPPQ